MTFQSLMDLQTNDAFYFSDQEVVVGSRRYIIRSFSYRLAPYTLFQTHPAAYQSRGTAYYTPAGKEEWELFARPYDKFFNLGEGVPATTYTAKPPRAVHNKLDGSLIVVGSIDGKLICKSKTSITSDHALLANTLLTDYQRYFCSLEIAAGRTPVFELIGPSFPIVLRYCKDQLVYLSSVVNATGEVVYPPFAEDKAESYDLSWKALEEIQRNAPATIEGYVVTTGNGTLVKVKVDSYVALHALKDSVNNLKKLAELILHDNLDDLLTAYNDNPEVLDYLLKQQAVISHLYNQMESRIELFYLVNKKLSRKDYAILAKSSASDDKLPFGTLMAKYLGKPLNLADHIIKHKLYKKD